MTDSDEVLLVTGGSTGIGAATATRFAHDGWRVVLAARSTAKLAAVAEQLGGPDRALAIRCDVTDYGDQEALVRAALESFGRIDVAFANAGFGAKRGFLESTPEPGRRVVITDMRDVAYTIRAT